MPVEYLSVPPTMMVPEWMCSQGGGHTIATQLARTPWCPRCGAWYQRTGKIVTPDEKYPTERQVQFVASCFCYRRSRQDAP